MSESDEDEVDETGPPPAPFKPPKNLRKVPKDEDFDVKSGSTGRPPIPTPPEAHVRMDKPAPRPDVRLPEPPKGPVEVRVDLPPRPAQLPRIPHPAEGPVEVRLPVPPSPRNLPRIPEPGEFDVVLPTATPTPKPRVDAALDLGQVDVVVDNQRRGSLQVGPGGEPVATTRRIGVVDTTFARVNMGDAVEDELKKFGEGFDVIRRTVPGIKDLPVEAKLLLERYDCDVVVACGMVGAQPVDKQCSHEASLAIQWAQLATNKHILEVFVHEDEASDERQLSWLMDRRAREHAENAFALVLDPDRLRRNAGMGLRQGFEDAGPVRTP